MLPSGASSLAVARSSPRVAPWFTITTGTPSDEARRTYRSPDITVNDDPSTTSAEEEDTREKHASTRGLGTFSPKNTTSGLSSPPQESAVHHGKPGRLLERHVPVWVNDRGLRAHGGPRRVSRTQSRVKFLARRP